MGKGYRCVWARGNPFAHEMVRCWDKAPIEVQYFAYAELGGLFRGYPESFIDFCEANWFGKTELTRDMKEVPYWYATEVIWIYLSKDVMRFPKACELW